MQHDILFTTRCLLRPLCREDLRALAQIMQDPVAMTAYEHTFDDSEILAWIDRNRRRFLDCGLGLWAVCRKEDGQVIGQCGLVPQTEAGESFLEIGYLFRRADWHQGYATEAAIAWRDYAFRQLGCDRVCSIIKHNNFASQAVARRMGMTVYREILFGTTLADQRHFQFSVSQKEWQRLIAQPE